MIARESSFAKLRKAAGVCLVVIAIAATTLGLTACQPQSSGDGGASSAIGESGELIAWSPDVDCSLCHVIEGETAEDTATLCGFHAALGQQCSSCHDDEQTLTTIHEGATQDSAAAVKKLRKSDVSESTCESCHGSLDTIAAETEGTAVLEDERGTKVNPHALPSSSNHDAISCSDCHKGHDAEPTTETAYTVCLSCHHEDVFECGTCHD